MSRTRSKADALKRIEEARAHWRNLAAEVGDERMEQPGPMGEWTFKDLAAHLTFWRDWTIARLEIGPDEDVPPPWPTGLTEFDPASPDATDWDPINSWIYEENHGRTVRDVMDEAEASFDRLSAAVAALQEEVVTTPGRFAWLGDGALSDADFDGHLREEHESDVRVWLAGRRS